MSRSIKNRNIHNIATRETIKWFSDWDYQWVDGGDGFLYKRMVYNESKRGQWLARRYWQGERLEHHVTGNILKIDKKMDEKTHRQRARTEIHRFMRGVDDDVVTSKLLKSQPWNW